MDCDTYGLNHILHTKARLLYPCIEGNGPKSLTSDIDPKGPHAVLKAKFDPCIELSRLGYQMHVRELTGPQAISTPSYVIWLSYFHPPNG